MFIASPWMRSSDAFSRIVLSSPPPSVTTAFWVAHHDYCHHFSEQIQFSDDRQGMNDFVPDLLRVTNTLNGIFKNLGNPRSATRRNLCDRKVSTGLYISWIMTKAANDLLHLNPGCPNTLRSTTTTSTQQHYDRTAKKMVKSITLVPCLKTDMFKMIDEAGAPLFMKYIGLPKINRLFVRAIVDLPSDVCQSLYEAIGTPAQRIVAAFVNSFMDFVFGFDAGFGNYFYHWMTQSYTECLAEFIRDLQKEAKKNRCFLCWPKESKARPSCLFGNIIASERGGLVISQNLYTMSQSLSMYDNIVPFKDRFYKEQIKAQQLLLAIEAFNCNKKTAESDIDFSNRTETSSTETEESSEEFDDSSCTSDEPPDERDRDEHAD